MAEITRPNMTYLWGNGGATVMPSNAKVEQGWTSEIPPHQFENGIQNRQDRAIAYLFQRGIPAWDSQTEYFANRSVVLHNGLQYLAIQNSTNSNPTTGTTNWRLMIPTDTAQKMRFKSVTLPYTLTADDKSCWIQLNGTGNVTIPAGWAVADWVILSKISGGSCTVAGSGVALSAQIGKNATFLGNGARGSIVMTGAATADLQGDFQLV